MDEEFYADLRKDNKVSDERKNEGLTLQERIKNIHAESLRKAGSKLEYDAVF